MRSLGSIILTGVLIFVAFSWAEDPPPPPRVMEIHMKNNMIDSIFCGQIDPNVGITFDRFEMKVGIIEFDATTLQPIINPITQLPATSTRYFCTSQIDSITFNLFVPQTP
jgi:hypothetical protein